MNHEEIRKKVIEYAEDYRASGLLGKIGVDEMVDLYLINHLSDPIVVEEYKLFYDTLKSI